jgi:hypothetical protein
MESILRIGSGRLRSGNLIKQNTGNVLQLISGEFWNTTTNLPKRVVITIKNAAGVVLANTLVKYAIYEYGGGIAYNPNWMQLVSKGVYLTDALGVLDVIYTGSVNFGETVYIAIIHPDTSPTESMIWNVTIQ